MNLGALAAKSSVRRSMAHRTPGSCGHWMKHGCFTKTGYSCGCHVVQRLRQGPRCRLGRRMGQRAWNSISGSVLSWREGAVEKAFAHSIDVCWLLGVQSADLQTATLFQGAPRRMFDIPVGTRTTVVGPKVAGRRAAWVREFWRSITSPARRGSS